MFQSLHQTAVYAFVMLCMHVHTPIAEGVDKHIKWLVPTCECNIWPHYAPPSRYCNYVKPLYIASLHT